MALSIKVGKLTTNIPFLVSLILLILSFTQTSYRTDYSDPTANDSIGFLDFSIGWMGIFELPYGIPWFANPLLIIAWALTFRNKRITPIILSFLASIFSASFLLFHVIPANEGGGTANIIAIGIGYWLWLASCITYFIGTVIMFLTSKGN